MCQFYLQDLVTYLVLVLFLLPSHAFVQHSYQIWYAHACIYITYKIKTVEKTTWENGNSLVLHLSYHGWLESHLCYTCNTMRGWIMHLCYTCHAMGGWVSTCTIHLAMSMFKDCCKTFFVVINCDFVNNFFRSRMRC